MDLAILQDAGLSRREAALYLTLLDLGSSTIGPLSSKTDVPSSKIYEVLHRLEEKGLASHIIINHQKHFQAQDPQVILDKLEEKTESFREHLTTLKERQRLAQEQQHASFYEGKKAIFTMLRELIKQANQNATYRSFAFDDEHAEPDIAAFLSSLALLRKERGLTTKILAKKSAEQLINNTMPKQAREAMHLHYTNINYPEGIIILADTLVMVEWEGTPSAVKIKSRTFADNYSTFFDQLYEEAKEKKKKEKINR